MEEKNTAEELLEKVESLDNEEKWKFLDLMYDKFYNKGKVPLSPEDDLD